jgi:hypothetical protein
MALQTPVSYKELRAAVDDEQTAAQQILAYLQRVGSLNFVAVVTRPDIALRWPSISAIRRLFRLESIEAEDGCKIEY